jgi:hypothetical protein
MPAIIPLSLENLKIWLFLKGNCAHVMSQLLYEITLFSCWLVEHAAEWAKQLQRRCNYNKWSAVAMLISSFGKWMLELILADDDSMHVQHGSAARLMMGRTKTDSSCGTSLRPALTWTSMTLRIERLTGGQITICSNVGLDFQDSCWQVDKRPKYHHKSRGAPRPGGFLPAC